MRFYLLTIFVTSSISTFGQRDYEHYVDYFRNRLTKTSIQLPQQYLIPGIKSLTYYTCNDTIFNKENCSKIQVVHFDSKSNLILDTLFSGKPFRSRKIEISSEFIKVTESSFDNKETLMSQLLKIGEEPTMTYKVDSLVINSAKNPVELYENKALKSKWLYDSIDRIIKKIENPNDSMTIKTTHVNYKPNSISESRQTKFYNEISNHKSEFLFETKSRLIVRQDIYNEKIKFLNKGTQINFDSISHHEPLERSRYTVYNYKPSNTITTIYYDKDGGKENVLMTVIRKLDKRKRIAYQYTLGEKGDTLGYETYEYYKNKVMMNSYQGREFSDRTIKYFNNKGDLIKINEVTSDPYIWKTREYDSEILTRSVDVNYNFITMELIIIER